MGSAQPRRVAIFRQNLFRVSEPFITAQAQALGRYRPLYLGRYRFGDPPEGAECRALQDGRRWALPSVAWQMLTRDPRPYERLLQGRRPSLVHAHFGIDGVYALELARRLRVPLVTTFHGFDATLSTAALLSSPAWANYSLFRRKLARQGDLFLCTSSFIRDRVVALGFPPGRTHVHHIGVSTPVVETSDPGGTGPVILHVARLVEMKGTSYLLRAFAKFAPLHPDARLVVVGDGPLGRSLRGLARSLGLGERVCFTGALPHGEVLGWMRRARVLVLPSVLTGTGRVEGLGMVLLEAASHGLPVIGSRVGGIPEVVIDGRTGFLVPERDPDALARRLGELLDDPALRRRMGDEARALVSRRFDLRRQTEVLEEFYDALLEGTC